MNKINIGSPAPDFILDGSDGTTHRLSDYTGKKLYFTSTLKTTPQDVVLKLVILGITFQSFPT